GGGEGGRVGRLAERVHVRVLEQQQVVVGGALEQGPLELVGLPVRDPPEPADAQPTHASSASQSVPWIVSFMPWRKAAAYAPSKARASHVSARSPTCRIAIESSPSGPVTTHGRLRMPSVERIPTWGWLMIGSVMNVPHGPGF